MQLDCLTFNYGLRGKSQLSRCVRSSKNMGYYYIHHLRSKNIVPPAIQESKTSSGYEGAYVKDPVVGFHDWICSFDLNSLYPHLIMQYNISPETMVGFEPNRVNVQNMLNQKSDLSDLDNRTITPNGAQFRTDKRGFLPENNGYFISRTSCL